ncbi:MAG: 3-oxo-tetronate kinase [Planctomycetota bacterium]
MTELQRDRPILGCIADDVTGATDLAMNLVQGGMRVVQVMGVPNAAMLKDELPPCDAVVVALKSRSIPPEDAVRISLAAARELRAAGMQRLYFKYCSTFDSTDAGNIGPVAASLMQETDCRQTIFCPAFPAAGRTVFHGHLFVYDQLLSESGMRDHPLNPMRDSNLVRCLQRQTDQGVGRLSHDDLLQWPDACRQRMEDKLRQGQRMLITDAVDEHDLMRIANVCHSLDLVTGGSGLGRFLPTAYRDAGLLAQHDQPPRVDGLPGRTLMLAGSCSLATQRQVASAKKIMPVWEIDVDAFMSDARGVTQQILDWIGNGKPDEARLVATSGNAETVQRLQQKYDAQALASALESALATIASVAMREMGGRTFVLAGGETSGAIIAELQVRSLQIGQSICTGVPWTRSLGGDPPLNIAMKSGNFGGDDFFQDAMRALLPGGGLPGSSHL